MNPKVVSSLSRLEEGNARFVSGLRSVDAIASNRKLQELAENGQKPFAAVLACADSRAPSELVFDCGVGDLFVCRLAGNITTSGVLASMEYAALHLDVKLIVVMAHSKCGAVQTALAAQAHPSEHIERLVDFIRPAFAAGADIDDACRRNGEYQRSEILAGSKILRELHEAGELAVVGAYYDVRTGRVVFDHADVYARAA